MPKQIDQIAKLRGWFRPKDDSNFYRTVQDYVNGETDLDAAIAIITQPIDRAISLNNLDKVDLMDLWYSVLHSSKRIPYDNLETHTKLVNLVKALQQHSEPTAIDDQSIYASLSGLSMAEREVYNDGPSHEKSSSRIEVYAWANYNYFLARLASAGIGDQWIFAIWSMRQALEITPDGNASDWYDTYIPAAATWVFGLGEKLYEKEQNLTPKNRNEGNPAKGGDLWKGGSVFSNERYAFWRKRFGEVRELDGLMEETKNVATLAKESMVHTQSS